MDIFFYLIAPSILGIYALLVVVAAIAGPKFLSSAAFVPVFSVPGIKLNFGRFISALFGLFFLFLCIRTVTNYLS